MHSQPLLADLWLDGIEKVFGQGISDIQVVLLVGDTRKSVWITVYNNQTLLLCQGIFGLAFGLNIILDTILQILKDWRTPCHPGGILTNLESLSVCLNVNRLVQKRQSIKQVWKIASSSTQIQVMISQITIPALTNALEHNPTMQFANTAETATFSWT